MDGLLAEIEMSVDYWLEMKYLKISNDYGSRVSVVLGLTRD
jgi:hypothetical protein